MGLNSTTKHKCDPKYKLHLESSFEGTVECSGIEILTYKVKHSDLSKIHTMQPVCLGLFSLYQ